MVSSWWFLGMIVVFTAARLVLVSAGLRTRASPSGSIPCSPDGPVASGVRRPGLEPQGLIMRLPATRGPALRYGIRHGAVMGYGRFTLSSRPWA